MMINHEMEWARPWPQARYRHTAVVCGDAVPRSDLDAHQP